MTAPLKTFFGTFQGKKADGVVQFRGVKYASVKDQLSIPEMVKGYGDEIVDATEFGPRAPAMDGCAFEQSTLIQCSIGVPENPPRMSGTECLNLNITIPDVEINSRKKLPVMVFIHGGGFIMGANYWPQYDPSRLVKLSTELGMPVIAIIINYRLGVLGNLTSQELRNAGYLGNNSLRDQRCALQWIKTHIEGFGGDSDNVTAFGESAGAASVLYQLHSKDPLFRRCISMSGTPIMLKPLPLPVAEMAYGSLLKEFGLENASAEERIQRLRAAEPEELVEKMPMSVPLLPFLDGEAMSEMSVPLLPALNGDIVTEKMTFAKVGASHDEVAAKVPGWKWCEELMMGDCQHDGSVFWFMGLAQRKSGIAEGLAASLHKNLPAGLATVVLDAYNIRPTIDDDAAMKLIIDLATDIAYFAPALAYARSFPGKTYFYHFNEPNPWDGPFKGCSTHMLDAAFLFQNFNEQLHPEAQKVAERLAIDFVKFVNGVKPWSEFEKEAGQVQTYGPSEKSVTGTAEYNGWNNGRRDILLKLSEQGKIDLDQLSVAWDVFIAGR